MNAKTYRGTIDVEIDNDGVSMSESNFVDEIDSIVSIPGKADTEEQPTIAKEESKTIFRIKIFAIIFLLISAIGVAYFVYTYIQHSEQDKLENDFAGYADKVLDSLGTTLDLSLGSIDAYVVSAVSSVKENGMQWPFVTIQDFAVKVSKIRSMSKALRVSQSHFVTRDQRKDWEEYVAANNAWVRKDLEIQKYDENVFLNVTYEQVLIPQSISILGDPVPEAELYLATRQNAPLFAGSPVCNHDHMSTGYSRGVPTLVEKQEVLLSVTLPTPENPVRWLAPFIKPGDNPFEPVGYFVYPILDTAADSINQEAADDNTTKIHTTVGVVDAFFFWRDLLQDILPKGSDGIIAVFKNACNQSFTYQINGPETVYLGVGDLHDTKYDSFQISSARFSELSTPAFYTGLPLNKGGCEYTVSVYPSEVMEKTYTTSNPIIFSVSAVSIFVFTSFIFLLYDWWVEQRQRKVLRTAVKSSAIVSSLFPSTVHDRLFNQEDVLDSNKLRSPIKNKMKSFLDSSKVESSPQAQNTSSSAPIADLFVEATVMFADIAGFTAWSSMRSPTHVFVLLESVYGEFDKIADRRGVFKVETIGDSYVAVAGVPEPKKDHALVMTKFAADCRDSMARVTKVLQVTMGPDTADLQLRFGLNSGPVTAGVLRGAKTRFQLFGDTVNTAARMESNGIRNKIQVSQSTADLIFAAGKDSWLVKRHDMIEAKGKGKLQTYWAEPRSGAMSVNSVQTVSVETPNPTSTNESFIDWNCRIFENILCQVIAKRKLISTPVTIEPNVNRSEILSLCSEGGKTVLDQVEEVIELPDFDTRVIVGGNVCDLSDIERFELRDFITSIANSYNSHPFHNFQHASHVTMSVLKILTRLNTLDSFQDEAVSSNNISSNELALALHNNTLGIATSPLTHFACIFASLIHDLDHPGVSNKQLVNENQSLAKIFKGKSIAEQNSITIAWQIFMKDEFSNLRNAICKTEAEMKCFRQLVINAVMATDIMDNELNTIRMKKWEKAFQEQATVSNESRRVQMNRKATIVIEHLMQASDVSHAMQHWHIYRKWNQRLFEEMYIAYITGRSDKNPANFWYEGELGFFDSYVIPLARKLHGCGVFGISSHEFMDYALKNREEWKSRGKELVASMLQDLQKVRESEQNESEDNIWDYMEM